MTETAPLERIVTSDRYPICDLASTAGRDLVANCQSQLAQNGLCLLPDFITAPAMLRIQKTARVLAADGYHTEHWRASPNGDQSCPDSKLAVTTRASMASVGYDRLPADHDLRILYASEYFTAFINALCDGRELFITDDPLIGCMLTSMSEGDELGWHYDPNELVVSLSIQDSDAGGEFEFAPRIRSPSASAESDEEAVLSGTFDGTLSKSLKPGTLSLFNGYESLHRVSKVRGNRQRIIALFNYSEVPYYRFDRQIHSRFFGRTID